ncbi:hypothetical protein [Streptomyces sp. NPDC057690]
MDLHATADTSRTDRAFHGFLAAVEHVPGVGPSTACRSTEAGASHGWA